MADKYYMLKRLILCQIEYLRSTGPSVQRQRPGYYNRRTFLRLGFGRIDL
jgi:hypothetical protein